MLTISPSSEANINAAQCLTFVLYYGTATWTTFRCGTSAERLIATLSPSSGETTTTTPAVITTTTPATTTTNPAITTPSPTAATDIGPTTIYSTTTPQTTPTAPPPSSHTAAIAGGAVGGIAGLLIIGGLLGFIIHRIRVKKRENGFVDDPPEMSGTTYTPK